jgi:hypothetical protein
MSKCLTVVAFALFVITGAFGLRNLAATNAAALSGSNVSAHAVWTSGIGPFPNPNPGQGGGGH